MLVTTQRARKISLSDSDHLSDTLSVETPICPYGIACCRVCGLLVGYQRNLFVLRCVGKREEEEEAELEEDEEEAEAERRRGRRRREKKMKKEKREEEQEVGRTVARAAMPLAIERSCHLGSRVDI